jgi:hypothetical protein
MKTTIYVFRCSSKGVLYGYTLNKNGTTLPADQCKGKWTYSHNLEIENESPRIALNVKEMNEAIAKQGFYINEAHIDVKEIGKRV